MVVPDRSGCPKNAQADTYRRMKKATGGDWAGFHPATNCLWLHYLADTLLQLKALPATADQKKALRGFRWHFSVICMRSGTEDIEKWQRDQQCGASVPCMIATTCAASVCPARAPACWQQRHLLALGFVCSKVCSRSVVSWHPWHASAVATSGKLLAVLALLHSAVQRHAGRDECNLLRTV